MSPVDVLAHYAAGRIDFRGLLIDDPPSGDTPFRGTTLRGADFSESLISVDFTSADLRDVSFRNGNVKTCTFDQANLSGADFRGAAICAATFTDANLSDCKLAGSYIHGIQLTEADVQEMWR